MGKHVIETIMGAVVLLVALGFLVFAYQSSTISAKGGYPVSARFDHIDGVNVGSDVRISGIKVGSVLEQKLDDKSYLAEVVMGINEQVTIPEDSTAQIVGDGLLGNKYIAILPGGSDKVLKQGGKIKYTQSSINIESLIGKFMYGGGGDKQADTPADPASQVEKPVLQQEAPAPEAPATEKPVMEQ